MDESSTKTISHLPSEVLSVIFARLGRIVGSYGEELLRVRLVCSLFRDVHIPDSVWREHICELLPLPNVWRARATVAESSTYRAEYARLLSCKRRLDAAWTDDYRKRFQTGKYSRWVVDLVDPSFCWYLLLAVRIFSVAHLDAAASSASGGALSLLRRLQAGAHALRYEPRNSTCAGSWWQELEGMRAVGRSAFLALYLIDAVVHDHLELGKRARSPTASEAAAIAEAGEAPPDARLVVDEAAASVLGSWWGDELRAQRLAALFDVGEMGTLAELVLPPSGEELDALFWDADGIACRGVEDCADGACADAFGDEMGLHMGQRLRSRRGRGPHTRQRPHLINLLVLGEHASARHRAALAIAEGVAAMRVGE
jgi:hypothetical protein